MTGAVGKIERSLRTAFLPDPQQLELLRAADGSLPVNAIHIVRGRGRPKGATNKRNKRVADYYVQRYGDPLDAIGQLANTPLRQLVEVLIEAEGGEEREQRLLAAVDDAVDAIKGMRRIPAANTQEIAGKLAEAIEKLADAASKLGGGKPGKLALDALAMQLSAHVKAAEYVHGKQPIAVDIRRSADVVVVAPEILKEYDIDAQALGSAIAEHGIEALDPSTLRIGRAEEGEFTEATDDQSE